MVYNKQVVSLYTKEKSFILKINMFLYFKKGFWYDVD